MTDYVIRGGKPGYDRLLLLARERWPDTRALLERAGVSAGMRCIDIGCGGGEVTMEIARLVAPGGSVVGVDMDEVKLALARHAAAARELGNVEFRALDVRDWDEPGGYDVVYTRFLLQHLSQPDSLLRRMWSAIAEGGVLIVEDADFDGWCCDPPNEGFALFTDAYQRVPRRRPRDRAEAAPLLPGGRDSGPADDAGPAGAPGRSQNAGVVHAGGDRRCHHRRGPDHCG